MAFPLLFRAAAAAARVSTLTGNMPPARKIATPVSFSRPFSTNSGGGEEGKERRDFCPNTSRSYDERGMTFQWEVPGCGKEDILVSVVKNKHLTVVNLKKKEAEGEEAGTLMKMHVSPCWIKTSKITAEVKDGRLTVVVPNGRDEIHAPKL